MRRSAAVVGREARARCTVGAALLLASIVRVASAATGEAPPDPQAQPAAHEAPIGVPLRATVVPAAEAPVSVRNGPASHPDGTETQAPPYALGRLSDIASRFSLVELPDKTPGAPGYKRPHHALGVRSSSADQWLHDQGVEVSGCMLPMLRMHTRVQSSGQANAAVWAYARCELR